MRLVVCHGEGENFSILEPDGIRRPYHVATMDPLWWEAAAELGLPRVFFKSKLKLLRFCLGKHVIGVVVRDGNEGTWAMAASLEALGSKAILNIYP